jgi:CheY-like chemotaxis protein
VPGADDTPLILVVEDDEDIRDSIAELLVIGGYRVVTAPDGAHALGEVDRHRPSLVLVDLMMPIVGGAEFIAALRDGPHAQTKVAVVSASPGPLPSRADATLRKPFDAEALLGLVERLLVR